MTKKKVSILKKKLPKKKTIVKKSSLESKITKSKKATKSETKVSPKNPTDFLQIENENQRVVVVVNQRTRISNNHPISHHNDF